MYKWNHTSLEFHKYDIVCKKSSISILFWQSSVCFHFTGLELHSNQLEGDAEQTQRNDDTKENGLHGQSDISLAKYGHKCTRYGGLYFKEVSFWTGQPCEPSSSDSLQMGQLFID